MNKPFIWDCHTQIIPPSTITPPIRHALDCLHRDQVKVFGPDHSTANQSLITIAYAGPEDPLWNRPERFVIRISESMDNGPELHVTGSDELGLIYGLFYLSEVYLGVDPFWFWADREPETKQCMAIPPGEYQSPQLRIRYRGWFINDEVCLIGWTDAYPPPREIWEMVFETILRCNGNMVIPGTDLPRDGVHYSVASEMGLWVTHHHAEPLGAEMFLRAYPEKEPIYRQYAPMFEGLWRRAVERNRDKKTIWVLGFRGQGDTPFWENDPSYATPESRAVLIAEVIRKQYEIVCEYVKNPVCATYLYGEITELYRGGYLQFPEGVIKIWADNGYGKMVSRRQGNLNPRIRALPESNDQGPHGIYYHVTFHDLQASSHLTLSANPPQLVIDELTTAFTGGVDHFLLVNSGNIRPHIYMLDLIRQMWTKGSIDVREHSRNFGSRFYPEDPQSAMEVYRQYFESTISYGPHSDDRAGDEFYHHPVRAMISHWMAGNSERPLESLFWATGEISFKDQVRWFFRRCVSGMAAWEKLAQQSGQAQARLSPTSAQFFMDNMGLAIMLHYSGCRGMAAFCRSFFAWDRGCLPEAFVLVSQAIREYSTGQQAMESAEHGHWQHFYRADWLTNIKCTIYALDTLRRFIRAIGDGPHYFSWYKQFVIPPTERRIYLENTQRRTLDDDELVAVLQTKLTIPDNEEDGGTL